MHSPVAYSPDFRPALLGLEKSVFYGAVELRARAGALGAREERIEKAKAINTRRGQEPGEPGRAKDTEAERELSSAQCVPHQSYFQRYPSPTVSAAGRRDGGSRLTALSLRRIVPSRLARSCFVASLKPILPLRRRVDSLSKKASEMQSASTPGTIGNREG